MPSSSARSSATPKPALTISPCLPCTGVCAARLTTARRGSCSGYGPDDDPLRVHLRVVAHPRWLGHRAACDDHERSKQEPRNRVHPSLLLKVRTAEVAGFVPAHPHAASPRPPAPRACKRLALPGRAGLHRGRRDPGRDRFDRRQGVRDRRSVLRRLRGVLRSL